MSGKYRWINLFFALIATLWSVLILAFFLLQVHEKNNRISLLPLETSYAHILDEGIERQKRILLTLWVLGVLSLYSARHYAKKMLQEKENMYRQNILSLVAAIEQRDNYTAGHGKRVGEYSRRIAAHMGLSRDDQESLYDAGIVHDIGKIAIPDSILLKPGPLNSIEKSLIEKHVEASYALLTQADIFSSIAEIVRYHHERLDGSGYPSKLSGNEIPLLSQIMAVADSVDAMTTNRIYKGRKTLKEALDELSSMRGIKFRADIIDAALIALSELSLETIFSQRPTTLMEMERFSYFYKDALTGAYTLAYLNFLFLEPDFDHYKQLWIIRLGNINHYNKTYGWEKGDELLKDYAQMLMDNYPQLPIIRFQGDDFILFRKDDQLPSLDALFVEWLTETGITLSVDTIALDIETKSDLNALRSHLLKR